MTTRSVLQRQFEQTLFTIASGLPVNRRQTAARITSTAFLGVASLIGVIVSHVIVLFDFIEEMHEKDEPLEQALLDAGIVRLRPVMITVGATILALFPLAVHGGPLWQPLCYAQIGGLGVATFITLLLIPVLYSIFVLDLKIVKWVGPGEGPKSDEITSPKDDVQ
jgi:multidrug efflux pump subunit AcrB